MNHNWGVIAEAAYLSLTPLFAAKMNAKKEIRNLVSKKIADQQKELELRKRTLLLRFLYQIRTLASVRFVQFAISSRALMSGYRFRVKPDSSSCS